MVEISFDYFRRISALHHELGIPANYAEVRGLTLQPEATELVSVGKTDTGHDCRLNLDAARAWRSMQARAAEHDIELIPLSGFRSVERQAEIVRGKLALGHTLEEILSTIAAPGYSEHHTGCAIDVGTVDVPPLEEAFAITAAYAWLERHGEHFGFRLSYPRDNASGFIYEPWHWCWSEG
ncbi:MAG TPA: M15 family metallopeptidase [Opitutaceae bacterium]|nr:M15 family metallopeptidase [Opitutaceae bacterium]